MRKHRSGFAILIAGAAVAACNDIVGNHERALAHPSETESPPPSETIPANPRDAAADVGRAPADADVPDEGPSGPVTIVVPQSWRSPNGAPFVTTASGTVITGFAPPYGHAAIVPTTQPAIPSDDYTVEATVRAPSPGEFGILTRVQPDGSGALVSSKIGFETKPFIGNMSSSDWSPTLQGVGGAYTHVSNARYKLKIRAVGDTISAKFWNVAQPEPIDWELSGTTPYKTGRGVGYYIYITYDAVLESMQITVP